MQILPFRVFLFFVVYGCSMFNPWGDPEALAIRRGEKAATTTPAAVAGNQAAQLPRSVVDAMREQVDMALDELATTEDATPASKPVQVSMTWPPINK